MIHPNYYLLGKCALNKRRTAWMRFVDAGPWLGYCPHSKLRADTENAPSPSPCLWPPGTLCPSLDPDPLDVSTPSVAPLLPLIICTIESPHKLIHTKIVMYDNSLKWWMRRVFSLTWSSALIPKDENSGTGHRLWKGWPFAGGAAVNLHKTPV